MEQSCNTLSENIERGKRSLNKLQAEKIKILEKLYLIAEPMAEVGAEMSQIDAVGAMFSQISCNCTYAIDGKTPDVHSFKNLESASKFFDDCMELNNQFRSKKALLQRLLSDLDEKREHELRNLRRNLERQNFIDGKVKGIYHYREAVYESIAEEQVEERIPLTK